MPLVVLFYLLNFAKMQIPPGKSVQHFALFFLSLFGDNWSPAFFGALASVGALFDFKRILISKMQKKQKNERRKEMRDWLKKKLFKLGVYVVIALVILAISFLKNL